MWERWGRTDPYYAVLADARFSRSEIETNRSLFFESGRAHVQAILTTFEKHFGPLRKVSALDHGCGVGRLTIPLAEHFTQVVGVDISPTMLAEARANFQAREITNIELGSADDQLSKVQRSFDFVNSALVLQHVPVWRGELLINELVRRVAPGGGFHLHLSIRTDSRPSRALWWASANVPGIKLLQNLLAGRSWNAPAMQMNNYSLSSVVATLTANGIDQIMVRSEVHGRFLTLSLYGRVP
jgi:2-polyprenyl-3-methyl-5-hydroxy-6-metoxy-1,4-benzoquinol methylase